MVEVGPRREARKIGALPEQFGEQRARCPLRPPRRARFVIVAAIVYFTDDVRTAYRLALAGLAFATLPTAARSVIREA